MKNSSSKNKFLLSCFRPEVVDIDSVLESRDSVHRSSSRRFSCIPVAAKHDAKFLEQENNWVVPHPPKRKLSKVIKALVFETILNKRSQYKSNRFSQDCFGSKRSYSEYSESSSSTADEKSKLKLKSKETSIKEIKARELSMLSSSNPVSESKKDLLLSKYDSNSKERFQSEKQRMFKCVGIVLALISLAFTVVWGKWRSIFWTSIWLCCFSLLLASYRRLNEVAKLWNTESRPNTKIGNHNTRTNN